MSFLLQSPGRKVKIGLTFETPEDQYIVMSGTEEAKIALAETMMPHEITDKVIDEEMGIKSRAVAQLSVITKQAIGSDTTVFMTKDELRLLVHEMTATLKVMDDFESLVDKHMAKYRSGVRRQAEETL